MNAHMPSRSEFVTSVLSAARQAGRPSLALRAASDRCAIATLRSAAQAQSPPRPSNGSSPL